MAVEAKEISIFEINEVSEHLLKKEELFEKLIEKEPKIISKLKKNLEEKGLAFYYREKDDIKAVYILKRKDKILKLDKKYFSEEFTDEAIEKIDKNLIDVLTETVALDSIYDCVYFDDLEIKNRTIQAGKESIDLGLLIFLLCIIIGTLLNQYLLGLSFGIIFGVLFGAVVTKKEKKKYKKKTTKESSKNAKK